MKSTVDEIRKRFDNDVERFSTLETGQSTTIDAALSMELIVEAAARITPAASSLLDVGCGAGNYTLKLLQKLPSLDVTLLDLSKPMLERAVQRISADYSVNVSTIQGDIREVEFSNSEFDIIFAAAVLHHLRDEGEWREIFLKFHRILKPGGSIWISDFIEHSLTEVQSLMWQRYGEYLTKLKDEHYREHVFEYIEKEDSPRPLLFQIELLHEVGFQYVDILHKNNCFAAFGALKSYAAA